MDDFKLEEKYKIQSVVDLFQKYFPFEINGKSLETLIFQGGMAIDISVIDLAMASGRAGCAGTIAATGTRYRKKIKQLDLSKLDFIVGINNLVKGSDYEKNYELGRNIGADYIASGAGMSKEVLRRIKGQAKYLNDSYHYWTIPIVSAVDQLHGHIKRNGTYIVLETMDAGGHNGHGVGFESTLEQYKNAEIDKKGMKIILGGGIRTPVDFVRALDAGFDAVQIGTSFLLAEEANTDDFFKNLILNAKPGDVGNVASPAGFAGKGFRNEGVMKRCLKGIDSPKRDCIGSLKYGCITNCNHILDSAKLAGIENPGDYCLGRALYQAQSIAKNEYESGGLYFCGARPENLFIINHLKAEGRKSFPARIIVGKFLEGVFDSVLDQYGLEDKHRLFLEQRFKTYQINKPEKLSGKIFRDYS